MCAHWSKGTVWRKSLVGTVAMPLSLLLGDAGTSPLVPSFDPGTQSLLLNFCSAAAVACRFFRSFLSICHRFLVSKPRKEKSEGAGRVVELAVRRTPDLKMLAGRPCMAGRDTWVGTGRYGRLML